MTEFKKCKFCGNDELYCKRVKITGQALFYYKNDGSEAEDNSTLHDGLNYKESKAVLCGECESFIQYSN